MRNFPPDVQQVLQELNKEEACSNLNQARLGKRVALDEKGLGITTSLETETYKDPTTGETVRLEVVDFNDPFFSQKEPMLYKIGKSEN